jgi:molybdate transport system permease protein
MGEEIMFKKVCILFAFLTFLLYGGLLASLFYFFRGDAFIGTLVSERILFSIRLSLMTATIAALLSVGIAIPSAYALSRYKFIGKEIIDIFLELPMVVSPAALGAIILIFFYNPLGNWVQEHIIRFVFAVPGIIMAQFITTAGIATRMLKAAMDEIPKKYEDVACSLGASPLRAFFTITLPLCKRGIIASGILTWAKALGEFGATITVAGTMAMRTETLPTAIYLKLSTADIKGTVVLIFILIAIGLGMLFGVRLIFRRFAKLSELQKL